MWRSLSGLTTELIAWMRPSEISSTSTPMTFCSLALMGIAQPAARALDEARPV